MAPKTTKYDSCVLTLGGSEVDCFYWRVEKGTYGKLGNVVAKTSLSWLNAKSVDIGGLQKAKDKVPVSVLLNGDTVFGGVYTQAFYDANADEVEIHCRDYAGALFDARRSLADLQLDNIKVSELVQKIAQQFKYDTDVQISNDPLIGTILDNSSKYATSPRPLWGLLVYLARQVGANIHCDDDGKLIMHDEATGKTQNWIWGSQPSNNSSDKTPILKLKWLHQPERNKNFSVIVRSHHQQSTEITIGHASIAGEEIQIEGQKNIPAGFYTGADSAKFKSQTTTAGLGIPIYYYTGKDGLKASEVQASAEGIAREIAKRLLVVDATIDGDGSVEPNMQLNIEDQSNQLLGFANQQLFISQVSHEFHMQDSESVGEEGVKTTVKALTTPPPKVDSIDTETIGE